MQTTLENSGFPRDTTTITRTIEVPEVPLSASAPTRPSEPMHVIEQLLRAPDALLHTIEREAPASLVKTLLAVTVVSAAAFGAVLGTYRGGVQIAYSALKVPLLLVVTLVVCTPSFVGLGRALGASLSAREITAVSLAACARFALVLAGLAPGVWLLAGWLGYHGVVLSLTACCAVAGIAAGAFLFRGLRRRGGNGTLAGLAFVTVFALVGAQTSWLLRPFLVHPTTEHVPFLRHVEGDLFHATRAAVRSAGGDYDDESGEWLGETRATPKRAPSQTQPSCERDGTCD